MNTMYNEANHTDVNVWTSDNGRWKVNERTEQVKTGEHKGTHVYLTVEKIGRASCRERVCAYV
jgi:hypothetical protein